jgi:hypothetical protein
LIRVDAGLGSKGQEMLALVGYKGAAKDQRACQHGKLVSTYGAIRLVL